MVGRKRLPLFRFHMSLQFFLFYCINIVTSFRLSYCVIFKRKHWLLEENLRDMFFIVTLKTRTHLYVLLP